VPHAVKGAKHKLAVPLAMERIVRRVEARQFKVDLDGYNQLLYQRARRRGVAAEEIFYFNDDGGRSPAQPRKD
jgi:hypothetical protein